MAKPPQHTTGPVQLGDSVDGVEVSATMISDYSRARAEALRWRQVLDPGKITGRHSAEYQTARDITLITNPVRAFEDRDALDREEDKVFISNFVPDQYVIRYYVTRPGDPIPVRFSDMVHGEPRYSVANGITGTNDLQQRSILDAFEMIEAQLPGRFRFEEVRDPSQADITFAASPIVPGWEGDLLRTRAMGSALTEEGLVVLSNYDYAGRYSTGMRQATIHEVLHALGIEHPQADDCKPPEAPSTEIASFFDTVMTYATNNAQAPNPAGPHLGRPVSLMPSDIKALTTLYPIKRDRELGVIQVGYAAGVGRGNDIQVQAGPENDMGKVYFPLEGIVMQPVEDTANDRVSAVNTLPPVPLPDPNEAEAVRIPVVEISQMPGAALSVTRRLEGRGVSSIDQGTTFLPIHAETIELPRGQSRVTLRGNVEVFADDALTLSSSEFRTILIQGGRDNRLTLPLSDLAWSKVWIGMENSAEASIMMMGSGHTAPELLSVLRYQFPHEVPSEAIQPEWYRDRRGVYHLTIFDRSGRNPPFRTKFEFESDDPMLHAQFQLVLSGNVRVGSGDMFEAGSQFTEHPIRQVPPPGAPMQVNGHGLPDSTAPGLRPALDLPQR